jgi:endoglycosylceramidase
VARHALAALLALTLVGGGIAAATHNDPPPISGVFHDAEGRTLVLRGFNTDSSSKSAPDGMPSITAAGIDREQRDMGMNAVRLLISWRAVEPERGRTDTAYLDRLEKLVEEYAQRGYHVLLDMHQDLYGPAVAGNGAPPWATFADGLQAVYNEDMWELTYLQPGVIRAYDNFWNTTGKHPDLMGRYAAAWRTVAGRFAGNPAVLGYDLMNEPYGGTLAGPAFESGPLTTLYQRTVDAIRTVDDAKWICIAPQAMGTNWGTPSGLRPVRDPRRDGARIAYCPHLYPLSMDLGNGYTGSSRAQVDATLDLWRRNVQRTAHLLGDVPVILGEFGLDTTKPGALDYLAKVLATIRDMGVSGYLYWSRDNGTWGPYEDHDGPARNLVEALDQPSPVAVSGTLHGWSATQDRVEIDVTPGTATAPTLVYLPAKGFPRGGVVTGGSVEGWDAHARTLSVRATGSSRVTLVVTPAH